HLGQRPAVHREGLQGVHSDLRDDACPNLSVLPAIEREDRALAQIAERGVHPAGNAAVARRCTASGARVRGPLQRRSPEQRGWLHHAKGYVGGAATGDTRGARPEAGGGPKTAADSATASRLTNRSRSLGVGCGSSTSGLPTIHSGAAALRW